MTEMLKFSFTRTLKPATINIVELKCDHNATVDENFTRKIENKNNK